MRCSALIVLVFAVHMSNSVNSPPRITKQPSTDELLFQVAQQSLNSGDKPLLIECEAEGKPALEYKWIKNGKKFEWPTSEHGTLVISRPRDEDIGQYQCFATNEWGTATSNSVFVRKAELNWFRDEETIVASVYEGETFKMTCQPPYGWPKPNVYWLIQQSDGDFKPINNSRVTLDPEGNLWFSNVTRLDSSDYFYYVCAVNSLYTEEFKIGNRFLLNVISTGLAPGQNMREPIEQYLSSKGMVALRGKKIELFCIFGGTPLPQMVWMKNGNKLKPSDRVMQGNYGKSLIIKTVTVEDAGTYTCEASNGVGTAKNHSIDLEVQAVPYFLIEPEIVNAAEDETAEFYCEAEGIPEPEIKWIHNGKPITEAPPNPRRKVSRNSNIIEKLKKSDTGNYGCNATNALGYVYKDVYVNVLAVEPEITQAPIS